MENSKIEWCHHTFNPWEGCVKVSPGCKNCYAEERNNRFHGGKHWGEGAPRLMRSEAYWREPLRWHRSALERGVRERVFCASLADVFEDRADLIEPRARLFALIDRTPSLDWMLLTKRPENIERMLPCDAGGGTYIFANVWLGTTCEDQQRADERIPHLLACRKLASKLFVSYEPALGPIRFADVPGLNRVGNGPGIDLVIVGGESGPGARPFDLAWARSTIAQCKVAGACCFVKQIGAHPQQSQDAALVAAGIYPDDCGARGRRPERLALRDRKGGVMAEWPADLRVREMP